MYWYVAFSVILFVVMVATGFFTDFGERLRGDLTWKQWLQAYGTFLMLAGIFSQARFHLYVLLVGALLFVCTFITWKPDQS